MGISEAVVPQASPTTRLASPSVRSVRSPNAIISVGFAIFVTSIPFETVLGLETLSLSRVIGTAFFLLAISVQPEVCFRRPPLAFWFFLLFYAVFLVNGFFRGSLKGVGAITLLQLLVLLWIASNLLRYEKVFELTLVMFGLSCFALSLLQLAGRTGKVIAQDRVTAFDEDPNSLGAVLALGLLAVLCVSYGRRVRRGRVLKMAAWICLAVIAAAVVRTGSRGASLALACGVGVLMLTKGSSWLKFRNFLIAATVLAALVVMVASNEVARRRWLYSVENQSMAGRERIYPAAFRMFLEKPLIGWAAGNQIEELGSRTGSPRRDTHNLYLAVLIEDGLAGAIPHFIGILLCVRAAWRARRLSHGLVPLALLVTTLVMNMDVTWLTRKIQWLVLGLALASDRPLLQVKRVLRASPRRIRPAWPISRSLSS
jgi:O-antigen ligase